ncbi:glycosyltransferase [Pseudodesulfovibrio sp. F-1]|uniref:Glycosyltransferase n=1 Tax=Pseudodesulfovibrio alkaliphilus TaxID=2661613 RepID=A0A7K1KJD3_9BACT|nr:glycosyltransferase family 4 protein [Pseudodesulfovibrio alkaliphilus]MUM76130.1 glycosyltransferase [Pseudodesulfovibrio alkaliphilus]
MPHSPVRVLHIVNTLGLGGTEKAMQLFLAHLDKNRFQPAVFSPQDGPRARQIRALGVKTFIGGDLLTELQRLKPAIVHIHRAGWPETHTLRTIRLARVPVVVETNVFGRHDPSSSAEVIDHTLFVSRFCLERYARHTGISPTAHRYSVLPNPVDTDTLNAASPSKRDFTAMAAARVSRPDPGKWSRLALDFVPEVVRAIPNFRYHIVGAIPDAVNFARTKGLDRHMVFHDTLASDTDIAAFLAPVSLLAHANDTGESFGLVIAEAMACGLPVVTHPCPGMRDNAQLELVEHGVTGLVASNATEYAKAVIRLLTHPEEAQRMGRAGREKIAALCRAQTVTARLETLYQDLLARKGIPS